MEVSLLSNPIVLTVGGLLLIVIILSWNKRNTSTNRKRRQRNFRKSYQERRKAEAKENQELKS